MPSSAMNSVRIARFSTDVNATSKTKPPALSSSPAALASPRPVSDKSTSVHPVKRFSLFQVLSPWRSKTSLYIVNVPQVPKCTTSKCRQSRQEAPRTHRV